MFLVFDIGGTTTRIASSLDGQTLDQVRIIPTEKDFEQALQSITEVSKELLKEGDLELVAGGVAGSLNNQKDRLTSSPNLSEWIQKPLKEELETNFDCAVYLENDAALGGLGEACFGVGKDIDILGFITIGTGVGGARIVNQTVDRSSFGFEPGHQIVNPEGLACNCGGKGHLESQIAGAYLEKIYGARGENIRDEKAWDEIAKYLAIGLNNTIVHWSPKAIILGGSLSQSIPLELVIHHLSNYLKIIPQPQILKGILGQEAGLYGALKIIQSSSFE